ncbi:hypothetical protein [Alloalcanivorax xenomutans]|uniref:hypothetical protein n=1 Tax=Alloalcanivorax xenomutans TaxID=1094342 RepID=UPI0024E21325|nr:hypothetical protein [Alloalcanivorax xenomutans]
MPLPLIIGAAALATAAYGAKKGYDGYHKHSEADEIVKSAQHRYEREKEIFDEHDKDTTSALEILGKKELIIGKDIGEFKILSDNLLERIKKFDNKEFKINIPKHRLKKVEAYSYTATAVLGSMAGAGAAGAAAGFAVYGGVMAIGVASTGTPIAALSGVAASNAALAAIGGGSLATGGLGVAGGTAILSAAVAAPILAVAGWAYNSHGEESLRNAKEASNEVDEAIKKIDRAISQLIETEEYTRKITHQLRLIHRKFTQHFDSLKDIENFLQDIQGRNIDVDSELAKFNDEIINIIENGYAVAAILVDLITTPIFKVKISDDSIIQNENETPEMELDENGAMILNTQKLDEKLLEVEIKASEIESA